ncbi:MAG: beta-lactamase family protein [Actinomycetota bacterium]|nr:beta-lactamase family protein [Actinomycetota bacterium]
MDAQARFLVYSVTKTYPGVLCLRLGLDLESPVATWIEDARLPDVSLRQLLNHTSGIPDYGQLPEYIAAVRRHPSQPWDDEELLRRALSHGRDFAPGKGWAYSNTGYLLVRRIVDLAAAGGFAGALERELVQPLGLTGTSLALELDDLETLAPGFGEEGDVRGRYHPGWVGHRTLASTVADQTRFWTALADGELCDLGRLTESVGIGSDAAGFYRPSYALGVMTDPARPDGLLIGHGGGGPGYAAAAFALAGESQAAGSGCSQRGRAGRRTGRGTRTALRAGSRSPRGRRAVSDGKPPRLVRRRAAVHRVARLLRGRGGDGADDAPASLGETRRVVGAGKTQAHDRGDTVSCDQRDDSALQIRSEREPLRLTRPYRGGHRQVGIDQGESVDRLGGAALGRDERTGAVIERDRVERSDRGPGLVHRLAQRIRAEREQATPRRPVRYDIPPVERCRTEPSGDQAGLEQGLPRALEGLSDVRGRSRQLGLVLSGRDMTYEHTECRHDLEERQLELRQPYGHR